VVPYNFGMDLLPTPGKELEHLWYYFGMDPTSDHWAVVQEGQVGAEQGSVSGGFSPGHAVSST
jgi:hypothetical protein